MAKLGQACQTRDTPRYRKISHKTDTFSIAARVSRIFPTVFRNTILIQEYFFCEFWSLSIPRLLLKSFLRSW